MEPQLPAAILRQLPKAWLVGLHVDRRKHAHRLWQKSCLVKAGVHQRGNGIGSSAALASHTNGDNAGHQPQGVGERSQRAIDRHGNTHRTITCSVVADQAAGRIARYGQIAKEPNGSSR